MSSTERIKLMLELLGEYQQLKSKIKKREIVRYIYTEPYLLKQIAYYMEESPDCGNSTLAHGLRYYFSTRSMSHLIDLIIESNKPKNKQKKYMELFYCDRCVNKG